MAKFYGVSKTVCVGFWIKADSPEDAQEWLDTHSIEDVLAQTRNVNTEYDSCVVDEYEEEEMDIPETDYVDAEF